ncbi:MAG: outer membrane protein assembly factor BamE [Pseudomonadales bacterium]|nr:outer membrane protein assembly factor BamE [Pseudomonadales bacterium]
MRLLVPTLIVVALLLNACSVPKLRMPRVYKQTVQQGNVITQDMVDQLRPGMSRTQVAFIMGEPVFRSAFNDDRWDFIYTIEIPGVLNQAQRLSLFFIEDALTYMTGDVVPSRFIAVPTPAAAPDTGESGPAEAVSEPEAAAG